METIDALDHIGNLFIHYLAGFFMASEAHEHLAVEAWNPVTFVLVFAEKNVFLGILFVGN